MTDKREDLADVAQALADLAKEAAYVAIGMGVLEFQKAQVRWRQLACTRKLIAGRGHDLDETVTQVIKVVDSTIEPVLGLLPEPAQAIVRQTRDELRTRVLRFSA
ncbi:MAG: hypothetical protein ABSA65_07025 [Acidimicrobiales bacterium]|jgi:hypothetical protein